jgi:hypothetical protein
MGGKAWCVGRKEWDGDRLLIKKHQRTLAYGWWVFYVVQPGNGGDERKRGHQVARSVRGRAETSQCLRRDAGIAELRGICGPRHITTAGITLHLTPKQPDVFQVLNRHGFFTEKIHQKISVRTTVIPQHPTSKWQPRYVLTPAYSLFVFRFDMHQLLHHYFAKNTQQKFSRR